MIVGWALGPTLETLYPLEALRMALSTIDNETAAMLIHHSDRGCQDITRHLAMDFSEVHHETFGCLA